MVDTAGRYTRCLDMIRKAEADYGRRAGTVSFLAVSKSRPLDQMVEAMRAGQRWFGESRLQEAEQKMARMHAMQGETDKISWHFIGPIQSNKTKGIAGHFDWVHSVSRLSIAGRLSSQRPESSGALNICVQVNIDRDPAKSGVLAEQVPEFLSQLRAYPKLCVRGLMTVPKHRDSFDGQRRSFARMRKLFERVAGDYALDTLSMGMSDDFVAAIAEGATIVRIGKCLFAGQ